MLLPPSLSYHLFNVVLFYCLLLSSLQEMRMKELWKRITLHEIKDRTNHRTICWVIAFNHKMYEISFTSFTQTVSLTVTEKRLILEWQKLNGTECWSNNNWLQCYVMIIVIALRDSRTHRGEFSPLSISQSDVRLNRQRRNCFETARFSS